MRGTSTANITVQLMLNLPAEGSAEKFFRSCAEQACRCRACVELDSERGMGSRMRAAARRAASVSAANFEDTDPDAWWWDRWAMEHARAHGSGAARPQPVRRGRARRLWCSRLDQSTLSLSGIEPGRHKVEGFVVETRCGGRRVGVRSPPVGFDVVGASNA